MRPLGRHAMQPDRLDFSSLDPARDSAYWETLVRAVTARAAAGRPRPVLFQLSTWAKPALALAAAAAFVAWTPALLAERGAAAAPTRVDGALTLSEWEASPPSTTTSELLSSLGALHEQ
jgi:hypothetical protein